MNIQESTKKIATMYQIIQRAVATDAGKDLKLLRVDSSQKGGNDIVRARIVGKGKRKIWNPTWCFYEIGIGFYNADVQSVGGIGFVSYPQNAECGNGRHRQHVNQFLAALVQRDTKFQRSDPSGQFQGAFHYYRGSSFPTVQAAADLAVLISTTFENLNGLTT